MRGRALFVKPWRSAATLLSPLMVIVLSLSNPWDPTAVNTNYRLARAGAVQISLMLLVPVAALAGCWEGSRLRRGAVWLMPRTRPAWRVLLAPFLVSWLIPSLLITATVVVRDSVDVALLVSAWVHLGAWALLGLAIGATLSTVVALPLSLGVSAVWMIFPATLQPLWIRHLNGTWETCCRLSEEPSSRALLGGSLFATALVLLAVGLLAAVFCRRRLWGWTGGAATVLCVAMAAWTVMPMGASPGQPRTTARQCAGSPRLCLWPEHKEARERLQTLLDSSVARWRDKGVEVPQVFDEGGEPSASRVVFGVDPSSDDASIIVRFATALSRAEQCPQALGPSADVIRWLAVAAGANPNAVSSYLGPSTGRKLTVADVNAHLHAYGTCR